jgi:hypothetical protein
VQGVRLTPSMEKAERRDSREGPSRRMWAGCVFVDSARAKERRRMVDVPIGTGRNRELFENRDKIERSELDLDPFISYRSRQLERDEQRRKETELWKESCEREAAERREANRYRWIAYHRQQIR